MANINLTSVANGISTASAAATRLATIAGDARGFAVMVDNSGNVTMTKNRVALSFPLSLGDAKSLALTALKAVS